MADVTLPAIDAGMVVRKRTFREDDDGAGGKKYTAYGLEDPAQRAALIAALGNAPTFAASGITAVVGALASITATPAFAPVLGRPFNVTHRRSADYSGSYQLERKFAGDENWYVVLGYNDLADLPEIFALTETEAGVTYRWSATEATAGSVAVRLSA